MTTREIPKGLATQLGVLGTLLLTFASIVAPYVDDDANGGLLVKLGTAVLIATIVGRMLQSAAALLSGAQPVSHDPGQALEDDDPEERDNLDDRLAGESVGPIPVEDEGNADAELKGT